MRLELHCHSTYSDGSLDACELAERLAEYGAELVCLTDHDTMDGCLELAELLHPQGVRVLRGLELSCKQDGCTIHLLIWGVAEGPGLLALNASLATQRQKRSSRLLAICERLAELGMPLDAEALLASTRGRTPGRPDIAKALVAAGHCSSVRESFARYLGDRGPAYVAIDSLSLEEGLALGRAAGARMGLAHPDTLSHFAVVRELFQRFRSQGLEGIEAFYGRCSPARAEPWLRLARELDLVSTAGSDFHGEVMSAIRAPGVELASRYAEPLREWLADVEAIAP